MDARFSRELRRQAALAFVFGAYGLTFYLGVDAWREQDQFFVERDPQLSYPANPSTVPTSSLAVTCVVVPLAVILASALWRYRVALDGASPAVPSVGEERARSVALRVLALESLGFAQCILLTVGTYNAGKCFVGRLRPDFFAACDYKGYATALATGNFTAYLAATVPGAVGDRSRCLAPESATNEASLSFPSGHAALAFAGMTSLSLVLHDLTRATSSSRGVPNEGAEGLPRLVTWRGAVACVPTAWAAYVAATRIVDYKHRPADVLAGAAVGAAFAAGCRPRGLAQWWSVLTREERPEASAEEMAAMRREDDAHWSDAVA